MGLWTSVEARCVAMMEGIYPSPSSIATGTFTTTEVHGELTDEEFPLIHFHRGYSLLIDATGYANGEAKLNMRAGMARKRTSAVLRIGYVFGQDAALSPAGGVTAEQAVRLLAANDQHDIEQVFSEPDNWGVLSGSPAPTLISVLRDGDTRYTAIVPRERLLSETTYILEIAYVPGTVYP